LIRISSLEETDKPLSVVVEELKREKWLNELSATDEGKSE
jgi:hypothetical protein